MIIFLKIQRALKTHKLYVEKINVALWTDTLLDFNITTL